MNIYFNNLNNIFVINKKKTLKLFNKYGSIVNNNNYLLLNIYVPINIDFIYIFAMIFSS